MDLIVEDFVPYRRSVLWKLHDLYYARRGIAAFETNEIPSRTTTNAALAHQYAELAIAIARTRGDGELTIAEIGCGSGELAANFLTALERDCGDEGRALYDRVRYVMSDFESATVTAAAATPRVRAHIARNRLVPALFDFRKREPPRALGGAAIGQPVIAIANYIACVAPTTYLRRDATGTSELCVQLRVSEPDDPSRVPHGPEELVRAYRADPEVTLAHYERRYEWRPIEAGGLLADPLHARVLARLFDGGDTTLTYPYGFFELLTALASWLAPDGLVLMTDYGSSQRGARSGPAEPRPVFYGDSLNHGVQFATLDAFAAETGWDLVRTEAPLRAVQHALLAKVEIAPEIADPFSEIFVRRADGGDLLDDLAAARLLVKNKDHVRAARFFARALLLDPRNAEVHHEMGVACNEAGHPELAIEHLTRAAALDRAEDFDHAFQLGIACFALGRFAEAIQHYERSVATEPHHVTWWNLALCHRGAGDLKRTCQALDRCLAIEPTYAPARQLVEEVRSEWWRTIIG